MTCKCGGCFELVVFILVHFIDVDNRANLRAMCLKMNGSLGVGICMLCNTDGKMACSWSMLTKKPGHCTVSCTGNREREYFFFQEK